ncbi:MAG: hypothetical protein ABW026_20070 [Microvirga sp.]
MILTILDPRSGKTVRVAVPDAPSTPKAGPAASVVRKESCPCA